jgi:tetratricopeptide (TPR) repeat protein
MKIRYFGRKIASIIIDLTWLQWLFVGLIALLFAGMVGLMTGYLSGENQRQQRQTFASAIDLTTQFELGVMDLEDGRYELAKQRFEYVVQQDPSFPGAIDKLAETLIMLSGQEIQPTVTLSVTIAPTATPDTQAVEELFDQAQGQFTHQDWRDLLQTIVALRDLDPFYRVIEIDRMLYLALRMTGIDKILTDGDLEGGLYDLALVEQFALLDHQADIYREWARLYQIGVSFWGVFPDQSVYYFSQLASAAPYLHDLSGYYAIDRYHMAIFQYGDWLAKYGDWCLAYEQYQLAETLFDDQTLQPTVTFAGEQCNSLGDTPVPPESEESITPTLTPTHDPTAGDEATSTPEPPDEVPTEAPPSMPTEETPGSPTEQPPIEPTPTPESSQ